MNLPFAKVTRGPKLIKELNAASCRFTSVTSLDASTVVEVPEDSTAPEQAAISAVVGAHTTDLSLDEHKVIKCREIDIRTDVLITLGFEYPASSGQFFALDLTTRELLTGLVVSTNAWSYPIRINSIDNLAAYDLANAAAVIAMYNAATDQIQARYDSGTVLKDLVRAATTVGEIEAIVDDRE